MELDEIITNKDIAIEKVKENGCALEKVSDELKDDKEVVLKAVRNGGFALQYASDRLKKDRDIAITATIFDEDYIKYASDDLKNELEQKLDSDELSVILDMYSKILDSKEDVLNIIKHGFVTTDIIRNLLNAEESKLESEIQDWDAKNWIQDLFEYNYWLISQYHALNSYILKFISDRLKNDKEVVVEAVKYNGFTLEFASDRLKDDKEVVLAAAKNKGDRLKNELRMLQEVVKNNHFSIKKYKMDKKLNTETPKEFVSRTTKDFKIMLLIGIPIFIGIITLIILSIIK